MSTYLFHITIQRHDLLSAHSQSLIKFSNVPLQTIPPPIDLVARKSNWPFSNYSLIHFQYAPLTNTHVIIFPIIYIGRFISIYRRNTVSWLPLLLLTLTLSNSRAFAIHMLPLCSPLPKISTNQYLVIPEDWKMSVVNNIWSFLPLLSALW